MLRNFWKDEEGSVMVFTAISMIALVGFVSLVVDVGSMTNERSLLQNAADSAALAGVVQTTDESKVAVAKQYVLLNTTDVVEDDIDVTVLENGDVQVRIKKDSKAFFSHVLTGVDSNTVAANAVATKEEVINASNIAIWAQNNLSLGNKSVINGTVYAGTYDNVHNKVEITGDRCLTDGLAIPDFSYLLSTNNTVSVSRSFLDTNGYTIDDEFIRKISQGHTSNTIFYFYDATSEIIIDTHLNINVISKGNIRFNGSGQSVDTMILYSTEGNITFNGSSPDLRVLLYTRNGDITFNGQGVELTGSAVGQNVVANGNETEVTFADTGVGSPLIPKARLIK